MLLTVIHYYILWHYTSALVSLFVLYRRLLWFTVYFFSIPQLLFSLFAPWKRMVEQRKRGGGLEDMASIFVTNLLSRLVGALIRTIIIVFGIFLLTIEVFSVAFIYLIWLAAPFMIVGSIIFGIGLLFF